MDASRYLGRYPKLHATEEEIARLRALQRNACAICRKPFDEVKPSFTGEPWRREAHVDADHSHATGRTRGLLCTRCNRSLGWFESLRAVVLAYEDEGVTGAPYRRLFDALALDPPPPGA